MRRVKYTGQPTSLGRHGEIQAGAVLQLRESEYASIRNNPLFKLEGDINPAPKHKNSRLMPWAMPEFDLRTVRWKGNLERQLFRMTKTRLCKVGQAMRRMGIPALYSREEERLNLIDSIHYYAAFYGWDKMDRNTIMNCGEFDPRTFKRALAEPLQQLQ
jgi:hypothetical protein